MTRPQAAALPLSLGAHGAALAGLLVLSLAPAELPPARAASPPARDGEVIRIVRDPIRAGARPRPPARSRIRVRETTVTAPAAAPAAVVDPMPGHVIDARLSDEAAEPGVVCVGCDIGSPFPTGSGSEMDGEADGGTDGGGEPIRVGGVIREPRKLRHVNPVYPEIARTARVQGLVVLECTLTPQGRVSDVRVVSGHPLLSPAAARAVEEWLFTPTLLNGVPVPVILTVTVKFELR